MKDKAAEYAKEVCKPGDDIIKVYKAFEDGYAKSQDDGFGHMAYLSVLIGLGTACMFILIYSLITHDPNFK